MFKFFLSIPFLFMMNTVEAKIELYLAYQTPQIDTQTTSFSNDRNYIYQSKKPFIAADEILSLKPSYDAQLKMAVIKIEFADSAVQKFNALAIQNANYIDHQKFEQIVGLGVVINDKAHHVIQGVHQTLAENQHTLFWTVSDMNTPKAQANKIIKNILQGSKE